MQTNGLKILDATGGGTKGCGLAAAQTAILQNGYRPDVMIGVSVSALNLVPLALGKHDSVADFWRDFTVNDIWKKSPITNETKPTIYGVLSFVRALVLGRNYISEMDGVRRSIKNLVSEVEFNHFKNGKITGYVLTVCKSDGSRVLINLNDCRYEEYIEAVVMSASLPIFSTGVPKNVSESGGGQLRKYAWKERKELTLNKNTYSDGGIRDHSALESVVQNLEGIGLHVSEVVSVFSRPENTRLKTMYKFNLFSSFLRDFEISQLEISKNDEKRQMYLSRNYGFKLTQAFLPSILQSMFDANKDRLNRLQAAGYSIGKDAFIKHALKMAKHDKKMRNNDQSKKQH